MQEVGAGLERIGSLVETLVFYERFVDDPDPEIRQHARARWVATKQRQIQYQRQQQGLPEQRIVVNLRQLAQNARRWGFDFNEALPAFPKLPRPWHHIIHGVPTDVNVEVVGEGYFRFALGQYEVYVQTSSEVLSIRDRITFEQTVIDVPQKNITLPFNQKSSQIKNDDRLFFAVEPDQYKGEINYTTNLAQVLLEIDGIEITIDFR